MTPPPPDRHVAPPTVQPHPLAGLIEHFPAVLAAGAVMLYAVSIIRTVGQLRSSHVDVGTGVSLIPLEQHLVNSIGILATGGTLIAIGGVLMIWLNTRLEPPPPRPGSGGSGLRVTDRFWLVVLVVVFLFVSVTQPWPTIGAVILSLAALIGGALLPRITGWTSRRALSLGWTGLLVAAICVIGAVDGYFRGDPLPRASITLTDGRRVDGPLIAQHDGLVFVATGGHGVYDAYSIEQVTRMDVDAQHRALEPSILKMVFGVDWPRRKQARGSSSSRSVPPTPERADCSARKRTARRGGCAIAPRAG
jgi:hypothetical protein